jgi:hypothetical protein
MKYFRRIFIVFITALTLFVLYLEFGGGFILNDYDKRIITFSIRASKKLPENFTNFYNSVYQNSLNENSWNLVYSSILNSNSQRKECPCNQMAYRLFSALEINHRSPIDQFLVARFIEHNYSQKDCLAFNFNHFDFLENRKGLEKISKSLFNKEAKDLQPLEIGEISALYENPVRYNRIKNPEKAKARADYFYNLYLKNLNSKN